jgi:hypothetical protein
MWKVLQYGNPQLFLLKLRLDLPFSNFISMYSLTSFSISFLCFHNFPLSSAFFGIAFFGADFFCWKNLYKHFKVMFGVSEVFVIGWKLTNYIKYSQGFEMVPNFPSNLYFSILIRNFSYNFVTHFHWFSINAANIIKHVKPKGERKHTYYHRKLHDTV